MSLRLSAVIVFALGATAMAGPKRVLVLPLDGNADPATRARLNAAVQKLAKQEAAAVTVGDATFDETAAAVGCIPTAAKCAISVRTTLGVDELIYGTVSSDPSGQATVVIRRSSVTNNPPRESTVTLPAAEPTDRTEAQLAPLFGVTVTAPVIEPVPAPLPPPPPPPPRDHTRRNVGIAAATGGGAVLVIGLALWASASSKQDEIDRAPTLTVDQLRALQDLEDEAQTRAIVGDVLVVGGLVLGGVGAWMLYKHHRERPVVVTPAVTPTSAAVLIEGAW